MKLFFKYLYEKKKGKRGGTSAVNNGAVPRGESPAAHPGPPHQRPCPAGRRSPSLGSPALRFSPASEGRGCYWGMLESQQ